MKKLLSLFIVISLLLSMSSITVYAAGNEAEKSSSSESQASEDPNEKIASAAKKVEARYGISIKYALDNNGDAMVNMNNIETLDRALFTLTPGFVKQVSSYYENKNGRKIEINYYYSNSDYNLDGGILMAAFEPSTSKIYVFLPSNAGRAIISGENPIAIVHEIGHAFHLMCMDLYGDAKMKSEWTEINNGFSYNSGGLNKEFNKNMFISAYATTKYEEDFAETFGHVFVRTQDGTGFRTRLSKDSKATVLGRKVDYIEKLISKYIKNPEAAVENLRKIYKTPTSIQFEGITFYGETLQYIGYPQPRNILKGILNELGLQSEKSTWVRALGAWRVVDTRGDMYYLFPGGEWVKAVGEQQAA